MSKNRAQFDKKNFSIFEKLSEKMVDDLEIRTGWQVDDFIKKMFTKKATSYFYEHAADERILTYYCPKPSFLDWLLRRKKKVEFKLSVKDILLNPPALLGGTERIYITEELD